MITIWFRSSVILIPVALHIAEKACSLSLFLSITPVKIFFFKASFLKTYSKSYQRCIVFSMDSRSSRLKANKPFFQAEHRVSSASLTSMPPFSMRACFPGVNTTSSSGAFYLQTSFYQSCRNVFRIGVDIETRSQYL